MDSEEGEADLAVLAEEAEVVEVRVEAGKEREEKR